MNTKSITGILILGIFSVMALACADVEQDNPNDPGADNYEYTGMRVLPKSGGDLQADGDVKIIFSDVMDPASLALGGSLMNGAVPPYANIDWTSTSIAEDTLTISPPGGYWDVGTGKTLTLECTPVIGLPVTLDLSFNVVLAVSANVSPSSGGTLDAKGAVTIVYTREMNPTSLLITGSAGESTLILDDANNANVAWSSGTHTNDTLTLTPKNTIWERGMDRTLHVYCETALSSSVSATSDLVYDVDYTVQATAAPADGSTITGNEPITIRFGESMNPAYAKNLSGTIDSTPTSIGAAWSTTVYANDTVTLTPSGDIWTEGAGKTLSAEFESTLGATKPTRTVFLTYAVEYAAYVRTDGDNTNPGTKSSPKKTIQAAIQFVVDTYTAGAVKVATGTFQSDYNTTKVPVISMKNGVSVYGGYATDFSTRGVSGNETTVEDTSASGGSTASPNRAVYCPTTVTSTATVLDSFTIKLADGEYTSGIFCQGNMTISNNVIQGKTAKADGVSEAYGVLILSTSTMMASPIISYNTIDPGYGKGSTDKTYGIYSSGYSLSYPTNVQIEHNTIHGGHGSRSFGIHNINRSNAIILNNLKIDCGSGSVIAYCINIDSNCNPDIEGNTLTNDSNLATMYGLYEQTSSADPLKVRNNYFNYSSSASKVYYFDEGITSITDLTTSITTCEGNDTLANWGNY